ncbi:MULTISPECIES: LacI family DNA-binding transcriptional regulator [Flavobacterium]|jgi:LacI family transcriptional regulator|uniref:HTH-type transcriptional regulator DegA n=1 Tax=Flavobacterium anhuiense TaxID=459526 RepID=A0AAC9GH65_9FLAO|nr:MULTISPECIES: LacI family DNA-binding transcriptional regulator [Flavobacterium]AOC94135.1 HTH-type transcriptional regulator DegA [Flavobacterium anhuiense]EJG00651.1 periplasmic binding protein/LacI transcriptional regulator [Flavobacterium sp. F52]MXO03760.1 substrate-binding domain-containing protein [Flavobacterium sp. HBTb2-11-1]URM38405.1 LacI family transcriptional regulator [Flavobacterium anhuiense]SCX78882.1 transcriptional regulator, LacI family [Flavobacterium anhuiense]
MKAKATLKQIAKELGVSVSTVSKALNDSPEISEQTKVKIKEYAKLKNYKPNVIGLNLKNRKTKTIGVIIPNILNSFFAKVFSGIEKVADKKGYNVITCISNESLEKEIHTLEMLSNGTIDGFILSVSEEAQKLQDYNHFSEIINDGTPIVMFDRIADEVDCDKVVVDDFDSALNSTQHLINLGCKNIALISSVDNLSVGKLRADGYLKALKDNNIPVNEKIILRTDSEEDMKAKIDALFENKIDGIFALDENDSVAALRVSLKKGYRVPEDISIIGFADGILASRRLSPSLTTVSQHGVEIGEVAAKRLIERLEEPEGTVSDYETIVIKTKLKERESTRKK